MWLNVGQFFSVLLSKNFMVLAIHQSINSLQPYFSGLEECGQ